MKLTLRREDQQFIEDQVKAGHFASPEDVVGAALERLRHDDFGDFEPAELDELIAEGERMLFKGADQELAARAWYMHVLNVAFNVGVGMAIGFIHKLWTNAVVNGLVGLAIGEAMLFTIPLGLVHGRDAYRGKASPVSFMISPTAGPGLGLTMTF